MINILPFKQSHGGSRSSFDISIQHEIRGEHVTTLHTKYLDNFFSAIENFSGVAVDKTV